MNAKKSYAGGDDRAPRNNARLEYVRVRYYLQVVQVVLWSLVTALIVPFCAVNLYMLPSNEYLSSNQKWGLAVAFVAFAAFAVSGLLSLIQELKRVGSKKTKSWE